MKYLKYFLIAIIILGGFTAQKSLAQSIVPGSCDYKCNNNKLITDDLFCNNNNLYFNSTGCSGNQNSACTGSNTPVCCCSKQNGIPSVTPDPTEKCNLSTDAKCAGFNSKKDLASCENSSICCALHDSVSGHNSEYTLYPSGSCSDLSNYHIFGTRTQFPFSDCVNYGTYNGSALGSMSCCCNNIPANVSAPQTPQPITSLNFTPEISIPNSAFNNAKSIPVGNVINSTDANNVKTTTMSSTLLSQYIQAIYNYGLAIAAILAAIVLMGGGLLWLTSGGDSGRVGKAKEMIIGAITGLIILFCAWIILNTVNPDLLTLKPINTVVITKVGYCCDPTKGNVLTDQASKVCPGSSRICGNSETCSNTSVDNTYSCVNTNNYNCCVYYLDGGRTSNNTIKCEPVNWTLRENCATPAGYQWVETEMGKYCAPRSFSVSSGTGKGLCASDECVGKGDNYSCTADGVRPCRCFNGAPFYGESLKVGDPCGDRGGSTCYQAECNSQKPALNEDYIGLGGVGGDNCGNGLHCCNPKS